MNVNVPIIENGKATPQYQAQWRLRGAALAIPPNLTLINQDRTPTKAFQGFWLGTWNTPLPPQEPVCNPDGTPTKEHLIRWP